MVLYQCHAGDLHQLFLCGNERGISGHLPGLRRRHRIFGDLFAQTDGTDSAVGGNLLHFREKWSDGRFPDLVRVSDHGGDRVSGGTLLLREDPEK